MFTYMKLGWNTMLRHPYLLTLLFVYEAAWSFVLLKLTQPFVHEWLSRYPGDDLPMIHSRMFMAETYVQITRTNAIYPILIGIGIVIFIRMLATPLLNSIIYQNIHTAADSKHIGDSKRWSSWKNVKSLLPSFTFYYLMQTLLILLPLRWLIPIWLGILQKSGTLFSFKAWLAIALYVLAYLVYILLIRLWFMYIQFGKVNGRGWFSSIMGSFKPLISNFVFILTISIILFLFYVLLSSVTQAVSFAWAGLTTIVLMFAGKLLKCMHRLWEISAQYHVHSTSINQEQN